MPHPAPLLALLLLLTPPGSLVPGSTALGNSGSGGDSVIAQAERPDPETPPGQAPEEPRSRDDIDMLRIFGGPEVGERFTEETLVHRDATGALARLDTLPIEAALDLLDLDESTRAKVDAVRAERARAWDDLFRNNIALILRAQSAAAAGDRDALAADLRDLAERAPELRDNAAYTRDLLAALPPADAAKAQSLAREYRAALLAELRARAGDDREALAALVTRERVEAFGRELRRAYERTLLADGAEFEALLETLDLTPEQQATVRRAVTDYAQKNILNTATSEDRAKLVQELRETLTHSQWRTLLNQRFGANN